MMDGMAAELRSHPEESSEYKLALQRMRRSVDDLQRELVLHEISIQAKKKNALRKSDPARHNPTPSNGGGFDDMDLDGDLLFLPEMDEDAINYIAVTFLTLSAAGLTWLVDWFILGEDTGWWWAIPSTGPAWLVAAVTFAPAVLAAVIQSKAARPLVDRLPSLGDYIDTLVKGEDPLRRLEPRPSTSTSTSKGLRKQEEERERDGEVGLPILSYVCFDTAIVGSEIIVAIGFLQALLLEYSGALGWSSVPVDAASATFANPLDALVSVPVCILAVAAIITCVDLKANETLQPEEKVLSELVYGGSKPTQSESRSAAEEGDALFTLDDLGGVGLDPADPDPVVVDTELRPLVAYLTGIKRRKAAGGDRMKGPREVPLHPVPPDPADLGVRLWKWQRAKIARRKYFWVEGLYWAYLGAEAYWQHTLVAPVATAVALECFGWYQLWVKEKRTQGGQ